MISTSRSSFCWPKTDGLFKALVPTAEYAILSQPRGDGVLKQQCLDSLVLCNPSHGGMDLAEDFCASFYPHKVVSTLTEDDNNQRPFWRSSQLTGFGYLQKLCQSSTLRETFSKNMARGRQLENRTRRRQDRGKKKTPFLDLASIHGSGLLVMRLQYYMSSEPS